MPKFKVTFCYEEGASVYIDAKDEEDAEDKILCHLEEHGTEKLDITLHHRDYFVIETQEVGT